MALIACAAAPRGAEPVGGAVVAASSGQYLRRCPPDPDRPPQQRERVTHPAARCSSSAAPAPARRPCSSSASPGWPSGACAARRRILAADAPAAADALRERIEERVGRPAYEELAVTTFHGLCAQLLRDEALEAGVDPFADARLPRRPAGDAARAHRRAAAAPPRPARQPERGARLDRRAHRPAQGRARHARGLRRLGLDARGGRAARRAAREREFGELYRAHDRMLGEAGMLDFGDLVLRAFRLLREKPHVRARLSGRYGHVLVDDVQDTNFAQGLLLRLLVADRGDVTAAGDDDQSIYRFRGAATKSVRRLPGRVARRRGSCALEESLPVPASGSCARPPRWSSRSPDRLDKAAAPGRRAARARSRSGRCASERAQAQAVAAEVERLVAREDVAPEDVCVLVRSVRSEGQAVAVALEERAVPYRLAGAAAFFQRAEVRDLLAWLRLLVDPGDAGAVVRALARPPVELRAIDLARVTQIARRRKLDMVAALAAALESPQIPPEARDRIRELPRPLPQRRGRDRLHPARPLRAPADRAARPAPPAAVRRLHRGRRAAAQPGQVRRAGHGLRAPLAAGDRARVRPLDRRRGRRRPARGGGLGRRPAASACR